MIACSCRYTSDDEVKNLVVDTLSKEITIEDVDLFLYDNYIGDSCGACYLYCRDLVNGIIDLNHRRCVSNRTFLSSTDNSASQKKEM